nr:hypothetical protein [Malaciobacter halophilus]
MNFISLGEKYADICKKTTKGDESYVSVYKDEKKNLKELQSEEDQL